ncbi:SDR family oxidoreductase [Massilia cavernae]|uniref:SDR family oxidoreductase n=1 Tax=Massilia cavernae TaxID=2320864 RepID=A0A418XFK3_9BURK|nr:SDR family oxidoreductase [Massilia cavernae]RJG11244.1 SDR family oxidoreductase [Massilia cavernae]
MKLQDATILVTGANRGLGLAFARAALERGARKVYAAARNPEQVTLAGVEPLRLDVLDEESVAEAARRCGDVTLVINNAGIAHVDSLLGDGGEASLRKHMETNFFGMLRVSRHFAPVLGKNGGGALLNVLSIASFINAPILSTYSISKTAAWGLTNALRNELNPQGTQVLGLHVGFIDTDLTEGFDMPKMPPALVAARAFDALEAGASEVMADEASQMVKANLSAAAAPYLGQGGH